jgi:hypothetical protein
MTPEEARNLLALPARAGEAEIGRAYATLKAQLGESLHRAPTPSLQAKYRQRIVELQEAFEVLQKSLDSPGAATENLPSLHLSEEQAPVQSGALPTPLYDKAPPVLATPSPATADAPRDGGEALNRPAQLQLNGTPSSPSDALALDSSRPRYSAVFCVLWFLAFVMPVYPTSVAP